MDEALRDLITISRAVGGDPSLVQGGGGNTSVKTAGGRFMYVKASGTALKDMDETRGWRRLRVEPVCAIIGDAALADMDESTRETEVANRLRLCCDDRVSADSRPSVESHLHAALGRCVVHLHPVAVGAYVCAKNGRAELQRLFQDEPLPPLWVPAADPGYMLARKIRRLVDQYARSRGRKPDVMFLEKHGLFVTGETAASVLRRTRRIIRRCRERLRWTPAAKVKQPSPDAAAAAAFAVRKALWKAAGKRLCVRRFLDESIAAFLARRDAKRLASAAALTPDELVYAGGSPLWVEDPDPAAIEQALDRRLAAGDKPPSAFLLRGLGLLAAGSPQTIPVIRDVTTASLLVRAHASAFGGPSPLTRRQREFILNWEAEAFRQKVAGMASDGDLSGRIAVVTGAGSGLGRSIAVGLAGAGAVVALADVDEPASQETAALIAAQTSGAAAMALRCNVTSEADVEALFRAVVAEWGGLDILVNAAGIAPPYALVDLPLAKWRAALEVNLTGYFLMARDAARVMIAQGMGGSIINLSSKSGLEASRDNTPYNATKAGEIHMARGWALELGSHGIRVNSVAPGNVFEGSRIWSPEYIRVCARKYGIEPEEVIPYYVGLTALKQEITGRDVAEAVIFLCSDRARTITGQTLVADGGQVMVR